MQNTVLEQTRPIDYLMRLAKTTLGQEYKRLAIHELGVRPGDVVLDLGCGPGADLHALAEAVGQNGRVIGVDHDPRLVDEARVRTADVTDRVQIVKGDIHHLELETGTVDCAHTDRVLQHVAKPAAVLGEIRRVIRPGGRVILAEPDWDTLIIDYPDLIVARNYSRFIVDHVVRNACIGRQLVRLAEQEGFQVVKVLPLTTVFRNAEDADKIFGFYRVTERAVTAGYIEAEDARSWLDYLARASFFASVTLFLTVACLPAASENCSSD